MQAAFHATHKDEQHHDNPTFRFQNPAGLLHGRMGATRRRFRLSLRHAVGHRAKHRQFVHRRSRRRFHAVLQSGRPHAFGNAPDFRRRQFGHAAHWLQRRQSQLHRHQHRRIGQNQRHHHRFRRARTPCVRRVQTQRPGNAGLGRLRALRLFHRIRPRFCAALQHEPARPDHHCRRARGGLQSH